MKLVLLAAELPRDKCKISQGNLAALLSGNWKARDGNHGISGKSFRCLLWVVVASYFRPSVLQVFLLWIYSRGNPRFLAIRGNSLLSRYSKTRISTTISPPLAKTDPKPVGAHIFFCYRLRDYLRLVVTVPIFEVF